MSVIAKPGTRLYSAVCDGQMIVVKAPGEPVELTIGGVPPRTAPGEATAEALQGHDGGTSVGKRYSDAVGAIELLCTKHGQGMPAVDGVPLEIKTAKPLPASD